jgi:tripartite-type tricarboxylate transporter receptor subunit TctC
VPAGTPNDIVDKIYRDTVKVLSDPETQATLAAQGMTPVGNAPDAFAKRDDGRVGEVGEGHRATQADGQLSAC